ncbi:MAG: flavin reductase [Atopobiaceae bacterium]|nr:flavin reductase [Atopobiaceae bacterium]
MVSLTLEQAEELFKRYDGRMFHMDRDDHYLAQLYRRLGVPKEIEDRWRAELIAERVSRAEEEGVRMEKRYVEPFELSEEITSKVKAGILLTTKADGKVNSMVIGWGTIGVLWGMPVFICYVRTSRFTHQQLEKNPQFTVNVQSGDRLREDIFKLCGFESGRDHDKPAELGLTLIDGERVDVPAIAEAPITLECEAIYEQLLDLEAMPTDVREHYYRTNDGMESEPQHKLHTVFIGKIVSSYIVE